MFLTNDEHDNVFDKLYLGAPAYWPSISVWIMDYIV